MNRWELPEGWEWTTLGDKFSIEVGATPSRKRPDFWGGSIPWVSSGEVQFCRIASTNEQITDAGLRNTSTKVHPKGTVLLGMIGQGRTRGQAAILDVEACNNQNCAAIRVSEAGGVPEYVYNWLYYQYESTRNVGSGNIQQALNKSRVSDISIPLPPPEEQTRIVTRLNALQARITTARAGLDDLRQLATALKRAVLDAAFRGELTAGWRAAHPDAEPASVLLDRLRAERRRRWQEAHPKKPYIAPEPVDPTDLPELPEGWCWAALGEVLTDLRNGIATKPADETGQAILRISSVRPMALDIWDVRYLPLGTYESFQLADGDLLFTRYNGNAELVGACAVVRGITSPLVYPDKLIRARLDEVDPEFIAAMVAGGPSRAYLDSRARSAAGQVGISGNDIRQTPVPLAPLAEQRQIAAMVTRACSTMAGVIEAARPLADDLTATEHAMLTAAFRGELVTVDP